ncbi:hypothetical protein EYF80_020802 [Liparis tanakae]|uniref:G-protein coupled receptors family 1 profile domain-containing protein n=1 Tax=Liparis tanakae TaxID=230148 RepID=A0A4Z2HTR4_9TELE|nr:hypothetical protein EYF80_020802 [Liparis tanakae]
MFKDGVTLAAKSCQSERSDPALLSDWLISGTSQQNSRGALDSSSPSGTMKNSSNNDTGYCEFDQKLVVIVSLIDVITLIMGQPVIIKLLLITFNSKKPDILNFNLALFHNVQYLIAICHLVTLLMKGKHGLIAQFMLVYVQIGGPMGLCFICMERYVAVIHPTFYPSLKTYRCRELCALTVWFLSVPLALMAISALGSPLSASRIVWINIPQGVMVLMVTMMVYCSARIARALTKCGPGKDEMHPVKKRALKTVLATSIITACCYLPGAQLHYRSAPHEGAVALVAQDQADDHLHVGERENKQDPGQHLVEGEGVGSRDLRWCLRNTMEVTLNEAGQRPTHDDDAAGSLVNQQRTRTERCHAHDVGCHPTSGHREDSQQQQRSAWK